MIRFGQGVRLSAPIFHDPMITVYTHDATGFTARSLMPGEDLPLHALWIDMRAPTDAEFSLVQNQLGVEIPSKNEIWRNHILNRLYIENDVAYMNAALITKVDSPYPGTSPVTFILSSKFLLTIHDIDPTSFRNFAKRLQKPHGAIPTSGFMFEGLLEEIIMRVAYNSEVVVDALDELSHGIFGSEANDQTKGRQSTTLMTGILKRLGSVADLNSKINESLHSLSRMLIFFRDMVSEDTALDKNVEILLTDTAALTTQTSFLSDKITFQLDATLGMINVEQNLIIKIFSVVAVFFMPPTLVTSMYGMNFEHMPELKWFFGYPMALAFMLFCAVVPYLYFRRRGWL